MFSQVISFFSFSSAFTQLQNLLEIDIVYYLQILEMKSEDLENRLPETSKCMKAIKYLNIGTALLIIVSGLFGVIFMAIENLLALRFFLVFSPIFMTIFGIILLGIQFKLNFVVKHFTFLQTLFGRGVFHIYMSSSVFYYFTCNSDSDVIGWVLAIIMFLLGLLYLGLHFGYGGKYGEQMKEQMKEQVKMEE